MSATLGGYIKDLRQQKNLSQQEVAFALGWKESSRLSRIEQGTTRRPSRSILDRLMDIMTLSIEERNQLLVLGNYLPTMDEVLLARKKIGPLVDDWPFPAAAFDFAWRIIYNNKQILDIYNISPEQISYIDEKLPWIMEIVFNQDFYLNRAESGTSKNERKEFLIRMLQHFKYANRSATNESWYQNQIRKMMENELFRELWPQVHIENGLDFDISNFANKIFVKKDSGDSIILNFYFFMMPVFKDPRFYLQLYVPADIKTFEYFKNRKF